MPCSSPPSLDSSGPTADLDRRRLLIAGAAGAAHWLLPGCASPAVGRATPRSRNDSREDGAWWTPLVTNQSGDRDLAPRVEGRIPPGLRGRLYRNGPGLFERGGRRKASVLDGDGWIQCFAFEDGGVHYRSRFVHTDKWVEEEAADRFLHPTWTTLAGGWWRNVPATPDRSQAGVTVVRKGAELLAFDEVANPWSLDPETLETRGEHAIADGPVSWKAHTRTEGADGTWTLVGVEGDGFRVVVKDGGGRTLVDRREPSPYRTYIHDFFVTERFVVLHLHPIRYGAEGLLMLTGMTSVTGAMSWRPELGSELLIVPKDTHAPAWRAEAPPSFMWHGFNAYEIDGPNGRELMADFVGYDEPDHFLGDDPALFALMRGEPGVASSPGQIRRFRIDPAARSVREEIVIHANCEFPSVAADRVGRRHRIGYACLGEPGHILHDGLARLDLDSGAMRSFRFGPRHQVGEPVHTADPSGGEGWLLSLVFDGDRGESDLAIFEAEHPQHGPVAQIGLGAASAYSFHGWWAPA